MALLGDRDLVKAVLRLSEFRPAEGATGRILISSEPGGSRVRYVLAASEDIGLVYDVEEPPSDEALRHLYLESQRLLEAAWDQPAVSDDRVRIGGLSFDSKKLGYDE